MSCSLGIGIVDNGIIDVRMLIGRNGVSASARSGARDSTTGSSLESADSFTVAETDDAGTSPASPALTVADGSEQVYYWKEGIYRAPNTEMMAMRCQRTLLEPLFSKPHQ
jgi:hypothetical protein